MIERGGRFVYPGPDGEVEVFQEFGKIGKSLKEFGIAGRNLRRLFGADTLRSLRDVDGAAGASVACSKDLCHGACRFSAAGAGGRRRAHRQRTQVLSSMGSDI